MIFLNLDGLNKVEQLVKVCDKYEIDVDVVYGRYTLNGKSVLGVSSLMGNIVKIVPATEDKLLLGYIVKDLKEIGAWVQN